MVLARADHFEKHTDQNRERVVLKWTKHIFSELNIKQEALKGDWILQKTQRTIFRNNPPTEQNKIKMVRKKRVVTEVERELNNWKYSNNQWHFLKENPFLSEKKICLEIERFHSVPNKIYEKEITKYMKKGYLGKKLKVIYEETIL